MAEFGYGFCILAPALMCVLGGLLTVTAAYFSRPPDTRPNGWAALIAVVGMVLHHRRVMAGRDVPATCSTPAAPALPEPAPVRIAGPNIIDGDYFAWSPRQRRAYWDVIDAAQAPAALPAGSDR